jgi:hypothetical protein
VVVAVELIVSGASEKLVVPARAGRDTADRIVIANDWAVAAGTSGDDVVAAAAGDDAVAEERAVVADEERVVAVTTRDGVVTAVSGDECPGKVVGTSVAPLGREVLAEAIAEFDKSDDRRDG